MRSNSQKSFNPKSIQSQQSQSEQFEIMGCDGMLFSVHSQSDKQSVVDSHQFGKPLDFQNPNFLNKANKPSEQLGDISDSLQFDKLGQQQNGLSSSFSQEQLQNNDQRSNMKFQHQSEVSFQETTLAFQDHNFKNVSALKSQEKQPEFTDSNYNNISDLRLQSQIDEYSELPHLLQKNSNNTNNNNNQSQFQQKKNEKHTIELSCPDLTPNPTEPQDPQKEPTLQVIHDTQNSEINPRSKNFSMKNMNDQQISLPKINGESKMSRLKTAKLTQKGINTPISNRNSPQFMQSGGGGMTTIIKMRYVGLEHMKIYSESYRLRTLTNQILGFCNDMTIKLSKKQNLILDFRQHLYDKLDKVTCTIFSPNSAWRNLWDMLISTYCMVIFIWLPIHIGFSTHLDSYEQYQAFRNYASLYVFLIWFFDILIDLNTGFYSQGYFIKDRSKIVQRYAKEKSLQECIVGIGMLYMLLTKNNNFSYFDFILLLLFIKSYDYNKLNSNFIAKISNLALKYFIELFELVITVLLFSHFFGCIWIFIAHHEHKQGIDSWIGHTETLGSEEYIKALYFSSVTMITVGYGDISPVNKYEQIFCILLMLFACGIFAFMLNKIGRVLDDINKISEKKTQILSQANKYMKEKNISKRLRFACEEYIEYYFEKSMDDEIEIEQKMLDILSEPLKNSLLLETYHIALKDSPIFKHNFSSATLTSTVQLISQVSFAPEQVIYLKGDPSECIYFIDKGKVEIFITNDIDHDKEMHKQTKIVKTLKPGQQFGAVEFFTGQERNYSIRSKGFTSLIKISRKDFIRLLQSESHSDYEKFCAIKDLITQQQYQKIWNGCFACNNSKHRMQDCPYLNYHPNKAKLIYEYSKPEKNRSEFKRPVLQKYQTLKTLQDMQEEQQFYVDENADFIDNYEFYGDIHYDNDSGITTSSESESSFNEEENDQQQLVVQQEQMNSSYPNIPGSDTKISYNEDDMQKNLVYNQALFDKKRNKTIHSEDEEVKTDSLSDPEQQQNILESEDETKKQQKVKPSGLINNILSQQIKEISQQKSNNPHHLQQQISTTQIHSLTNNNNKTIEKERGSSNQASSRKQSIIHVQNKSRKSSQDIDVVPQNNRRRKSTWKQLLAKNTKFFNKVSQKLEDNGSNVPRFSQSARNGYQILLPNQKGSMYSNRSYQTSNHNRFGNNSQQKFYNKHSNNDKTNQKLKDLKEFLGINFYTLYQKQENLSNLFFTLNNNNNSNNNPLRNTLQNINNLQQGSIQKKKDPIYSMKSPSAQLQSSNNNNNNNNNHELLMMQLKKQDDDKEDDKYQEYTYYFPNYNYQRTIMKYNQHLSIMKFKSQQKIQNAKTRALTKLGASQKLQSDDNNNTKKNKNISISNITSKFTDTVFRASNKKESQKMNSSMDHSLSQVVPINQE